MTIIRWMLAFALLSTLAGCASKPAGCAGDACKRPDSNDNQLVIWWSPDLRQGLGDNDETPDFTVVPLRD